MKSDSIKEFVRLHRSLLAEREELTARLKEVTEALGAFGVVSEQPTKNNAPRTPKAAGKRAKNTLSLKEAVLEVVKGKAMTKEEVLKAVEGIGYQFRTSNPLNSIGTVLYGKKPKFKNNDGRFSLG